MAHRLPLLAGTRAPLHLEALCPLLLSHQTSPGSMVQEGLKPRLALVSGRGCRFLSAQLTSTSPFSVHSRERAVF